MRPGEALGLWWEDLTFAEREIRVARSLVENGKVDTPKSGHGRTVDMSKELARVLVRLQIERKAETLRRGWRAVPPRVFCNTEGGPLNRIVVERAFKRVLKAAGLPLHFTPHCLRHTYASLLLQMGVRPVYVQRQLGHSSIKPTVDTYGRWLPMGDQSAVDRLDEASGSKVVANAGVNSQRPTQPLDSVSPDGEREPRVSIIGH
jgi:integrase